MPYSLLSEIEMAETNVFTTYVLPIAGYALGVAGFLYGAWKDIRLRRFHHRAKAPHFVYYGLAIDFAGAGQIQSRPWVYDYPEEPAPLDGSLRRMNQPYVVPSDYPGGRAVGVILRISRSQVLLLLRVCISYPEHTSSLLCLFCESGFVSRLRPN